MSHNQLISQILVLDTLSLSPFSFDSLYFLDLIVSSTHGVLSIVNREQESVSFVGFDLLELGLHREVSGITRNVELGNSEEVELLQLRGVLGIAFLRGTSDTVLLLNDTKSNTLAILSLSNSLQG